MKNQKQNIKTKNLKTIFKDSRFYFTLGIILFALISGLLAFPTYNSFVEIKADLKQIIGEIEGDNNSGRFLGLRGELKKVEAEYNESKKTVDKLNEAKQEILDLVFSEEEDIIFLTQLLERYAIDHDSTKNPFQMTSLSFSKAKAPQKTDPKAKKSTPNTPIGYSTIQINLPIIASKKNFEEFIEFVNNSGSLQEEDFYREEIPVPLMTIESLSFSYAENPNDANQEIVNANFIINTYIRLKSK